MNERFNFFDVYGYLLPGTVLILNLALPFALLGGVAIPDNIPLAKDVAGVVGALVVAYLAGHVLALLARTGLPSHVRYDLGGGGAVDVEPSVVQFDRLPSPVRQRLGAAIKKHFDLDVYAEDVKERKSARESATFLCRAYSQQRGAATYTEQFQGLYNFTRHTAMACAIGGMSFLGWWGQRMASDCWDELIGYVTPLALAVGIVRWWCENLKWRQYPKPGTATNAPQPLTAWPLLQRQFWLWMMAFWVSAGFNAATFHAGNHLSPWWVALVCSLALFGMAFLLRGAHRSHTWDFASAILNDFLACCTSAEAKDVTKPTPGGP